MRRFAGNDRLIHNEITSAAVDAPENETFVESGVEPSSPADLEIQIASGDVFIEGSPVSVSSQTETVTDVSDEVTESAYRYHTVSVDPTGTLVVNSSPTGEFDPETPSEPPLTQVTEPTHPAGNCFIGTAFQVNDRIERVYDGRYVEPGRVPTGAIIMWSGAIPDIPVGWTLCDGTNGTPDLTDRFVTGAGGQYEVGDTGGEDEHTLTEDELASHTHTGETTIDGEHSHTYDHPIIGNENDDTSGGTNGSPQQTSTDGAHNHDLEIDATGGGQPHENRPPFYALAYIQKL